MQGPAMRAELAARRTERAINLNHHDPPSTIAMRKEDEVA